MAEMTKKYDVDGIPTSLKDLGYLYVGLDDHWQNCTRTCANGTVIPSWYVHNNFDYQGCDNKWHNGTNNTGSTVPPWYNDDGTPQIDMHRFPDMKGMVDKAHRMGLRAGWYMGNYQCRDAMGNHKWDLPKLVAGSVKAIAKYGFDSVKIDSGFPVGQNMSLWADLLNATGRPVMIENCHQGGDGPGIIADGKWDGNCTGLTPVSDCPFNFWRTTGDPEPGWGTIMRELNSLRKIVNTNYPNAKRKGAPEYNADPPRSRPGGFAYPGTMVVGDGSMTHDENRVHFGAWCIVSSPLILAYNLSDVKRHNLVWDIITNKEAITVNQIWAGHPGSQVLAGIGNNKEVEVWTKPLGEGRTAVFILNTADKATTMKKTPASLTSFEGDLVASKCDPHKSSQRWLLSPGVIPGDSNKTNVRSAVSSTSGCWEITACSTRQNAHVDTGHGCKPLPKSCEKICDCNGAWSFNKNGTISSVMDGQCLQVSVSGAVNVGTCTGKANQKFTTVPDGDDSIIVKQGDLCVDNNGHPTPPGNVTVTIELSKLNLGITGTVKVRDVWQKKDLGDVTDTFTTNVNHHGSVFLILMPPHSKWPLPFELAPWMRN